MKKSALHIFSVWEERGVFDELFINELRSLIGESCVSLFRSTFWLFWGGVIVGAV